MRKRGEIELQRDLFISQRGGNGNGESDATAPTVARSATNSKQISFSSSPEQEY